jgi:type I restriction enzyme M protein
MDEVVKNDYNLSPSRYVETAEAVVYREIPQLLGELEELEEQSSKIDVELKSILSKIGFEVGKN